MTVWISLNYPASHFAWFSYCWGKQVCINVLLWSHKGKDIHMFFWGFFLPSESQGYKGCSRQIIHLILIHDLEKRKKMNKVRHIKATDTFKHSFQRSPSFPSSCLSYKWKSFEFLAARPYLNFIWQASTELWVAGSSEIERYWWYTQDSDLIKVYMYRSVGRKCMQWLLQMAANTKFGIFG